MRTLTLADPALLARATPSTTPPPSLASTVAVWWADDLVSVGDGNPVSSWVDRVNGVTVASTLTARPTFRLSSIASKPAVDFDGSNDYLELASSIGTPSTGCVIAVLQNDLATTGNTVVWAHSNSGSSIIYLFGSEHTTGAMRLDGTNGGGGTSGSRFGATTNPGTTARLLEWSHDGSIWSLRVDNNAQTLTSLIGATAYPWFNGLTSPNRFDIGCLNNGSRIAFWDGKVAFLAVLAAPLSSGDRAALKAWVAAYYGLTLA